MATLQFPDSPGPNAVYDAPNGVQYVWTGEYWAANDAEDRFDARYVKVTGDNMTGNLTLGTDKIDLDASSGDISMRDLTFRDISGQLGTFNRDAGSSNSLDIGIDNVSSAYWKADGEIQIGGTLTNDPNTTVPNISIKADGTATFAEAVDVGGGSSSATNYGLIAHSGQPGDDGDGGFRRTYSAVYARNMYATTPSGGYVWKGAAHDDGNNITSSITGTGSATFAGGVEVDVNAGYTTGVGLDAGTQSAVIAYSSSSLNTDTNKIYVYEGDTDTVKAAITAGGDITAVGAVSFGWDKTGSQSVIKVEDNLTDGRTVDIKKDGSALFAAGGFQIGTTSLFAGGSVMPYNQGSLDLQWSDSTGIISPRTSTRLLKTNIADLEYGVEEIKKLKPRIYTPLTREGEAKTQEVGFIADEVSSVMPELAPFGKKSYVTGNDEDNELIPISVQYKNLTAVLTKALQESVTRIEELEAKVAALES